MGGSWSLPGSPAPPGWDLCWDTLAASFQDVLAPLAGCRQDPVFHAEGDVLIHTRGVVEAMAADEAWRALPAPPRSTLLAAALLHDIGKPHTSRVEEGRIRTRGHAARGAAMVRRLLYRAHGLESPPLHQREEIVELVRHHGLAISLLKKEDPVWSALAATARLPGRWLAMLGRADVLGRESSDRAELLDRLDLFQEHCLELGCLEGPRSFPSGEVRHRYLNRDLSHPDAPLPEPAGSRVALLSGLPGAGKDTWISTQGRGRAVISLDDIRRRMGVKPDGNQGRVAQEARAQARPLLAAGEPFIWNSTNTTRSMRRRLVRYFRRYNAHVTITYIETPYTELRRRNRARGKGALPASVLERLVDGLEVPAPQEANAVELLEIP